ncbi:MAG TPA: SGNH/GDSL hydrolase family protein [Solirubrobacteraceae bacterium]|nr:SGNH/GDSL hydrolase family protein [Solirubrobacteraceae bacterium]
MALYVLLRIGGAAFDSDTPAAATPVPVPAGSHWIATWGASPQAATAGNLSRAGFRDATIREIVLTSAGGVRLRVRLTNAYGSGPLRIGLASIAVDRGGPNTVPGTSRALYFDHRRSVVIAPGDDAISDPVALMVPPSTRLAVSIFLPRATGPATQHADAQQVNYAAAGAHTADGGGAFKIRTRSWYFLDGVEVLGARRALGSVVALGDSITDGVGSGTGTNQRWPNDLAGRLNARSGATLAVVDEGIGGNRVLNSSLCCGVSAVARFERDVGDQAGARDVILLEGINDIGYSQSHGLLTAPHTAVSALQIVRGYERIITLAHTAGLRIFGATLTPFEGARYWTPAGEAKRDAINSWIRTSGAFDGVIEFAGAVGDPADPNRLNPAYDSGDHLHPNAAGYRAMAAAINIGALLAAGGD